MNAEGAFCCDLDEVPSTHLSVQCLSFSFHPHKHGILQADKLATFYGLSRFIRIEEH